MAHGAPRHATPGGLRILSVTETAAVLGVTRSTLWRYIRAGHFPPPIQVGPSVHGKRGWPSFMVESWLQSRPTMPGAA
jgi:predicted DNA-binding transcriptional regulator AlpA